MNQKIPRNISPTELKSWFDEGVFSPVLIDVREKEELEIASFKQKFLHLPLSDSLAWLSSYEKHLSFDHPVVVICHSGVRSWNFGMWLLQQSWGYEVWNLDGGIDAWSLEVDSSVVRY